MKFINTIALQPLLLGLLTFFGYACSDVHTMEQSNYVTSPDGNVKIYVHATDSGLFYNVLCNQTEVISHSRLGLVSDAGEFLTNKCVVSQVEKSTYHEKWKPAWGEADSVKEHYNELILSVQKADNTHPVTFVARVFDDGIGFRYEYSNAELDSIKIFDELTEFNFTSDGDLWWIPAFEERNYEYLYKQSRLAHFDTLSETSYVHTPLTLKLDNGTYASIHEAALVDFPSMTLEMKGDNGLKSFLAPWQNGIKAYVLGNFKTPWRTIQLSNTPGGLLESKLILNLNEPNQLGSDLGWVRPIKYMGIWWGLHIGKWTFRPSSRHGATTENSIQYIDFASKHGFDALLIEGWNEGWVVDWWKGIPNANFTKPVPGFDLDSVYNHARSMGVEIIAHHETTGDTEAYEAQLEDIYAFCQANGINYIKTGYVGHNFLNGESHYGQYGVRHYRKVIETASKYEINIIAHESVKPTGERRTFPNILAMESARGMEFNGWYEGGNPVDHTLILPFTRGLAGPMDFTPGIFDILFGSYSGEQRVNSTLSKQLALYVTIYSPAQMAADLIQNYEGNPALQFIKDVPVDWSESKVLSSEIGNYLMVVRKDKFSNDWFLGAMTDEEKREFTVKLDFLENGNYEAEIYQDSKKTDMDTAPAEYEILKKIVSQKDSLKLSMANGGGAAIRFRMMTE